MKRLYYKHGSYYYVTRDNKWTRLGKDRTLAEKAAQRLYEDDLALKGITPSIANEKERLRTLEPSWNAAQPAIRELWQRTRNRAHTTNRSFTLTKGDLSSLIIQQQGRCLLSGIVFSLDRVGAARKRPWAPSVDRIDNAKGYEPDNIRIVCVMANLAMNEWGLEPLLTFLDALQTNRAPLDKLRQSESLARLLDLCA